MASARPLTIITIVIRIWPSNEYVINSYILRPRARALDTACKLKTVAAPRAIANILRDEKGATHWQKTRKSDKSTDSTDSILCQPVSIGGDHRCLTTCLLNPHFQYPLPADEDQEEISVINLSPLHSSKLKELKELAMSPMAIVTTSNVTISC